MEALQVGSGDVVSLVGGGGKTSLCLRLAAEAAGAGLRAVFTTTTRILPPPIPWGVTLPEGNPVCVVGSVREDGKLGGVPPDQVLPVPRGLVVVEADGSAGRPLKIPLAHEPVIPASSTVVVPVVGASVLGKPFTADWVHRADSVADPPYVVTAAWIAALFAGPTVQGRPPGARVVPCVNQADSPERLAAAVEIGQALLASGFGLVLLTSARDPESPVVDVVRREGV